MSYSYTADSAETLLTMERLLIAEKASVREVIQDAYRLGVIDGQLQMANVGAPHATDSPSKGKA